LPLAGVRILDITLVVGAPYGTMLLADMGAEVIRVETRQNFPSTTRGIWARPTKEMVVNGGSMGAGYPDMEPGERPWNRFALFNCHARNKRSMTVDPRRPEGREVVLRLARAADGVIENNAPGTLEKLGIGYEALRQGREDFIMVSVSGMGQTGPYRHFRGYGAHFEDVTGSTWLRTYPDGAFSSVTVPSDAASGVGLVIAFMAALHYRRRTGRGQYVDLSMAENYIPQMGEAYLDYALNGRVQRGLGNRSPYLAPQGAYRCAPEAGGPDDYWVALAVDGEMAWRGLCGVIGRPEWAEDERFRDMRGRAARHDEIDAAISGWARSLRQMEAQRILQEAGVPAGAVLDEAGEMEDVHLGARGFFQEITGAETGTHRYPVEIFHASRTPQAVRRAPVRLGEDNEFVYRELLGYTAGEYRALEEAGHIGEDFVPEIS
jgi:benzylsuccinate CoA-transferase BbsF subunit/naphthyl-2-methylsuccinate CoA transferase subunit